MANHMYYELPADPIESTLRPLTSSQTQTADGISSTLVASNVPEISKVTILVPVFGSAVGMAAAVGGNVGCFPRTNSRVKPPLGDGKICSFQT